MFIPAITNESEYKAALTEIESLMSATRNTLRGDRLDKLVATVTVYEKKLHEEFGSEKTVVPNHKA